MSASKPIIMMIDYSWRSPEHTRSQFVFICLFSGVRLHLPDSADDRRDVSEHRTERMVFRADHVVDPLGTAAPPRPAMNSRRAMVAVICLPRFSSRRQTIPRWDGCIERITQLDAWADVRTGS